MTLNATQEEIKSLKNYMKGGHHLNFNKNLRSGLPLTPSQKKQYRDLYNLIDKNRISEDMIVYRGIVSSEKNFIDSIGLNRSFTSTSKDRPFHSGECCQLIIHLKKGSRATDVSEYDKLENEVLIGPGIFNIIKTYKKDLVIKSPSIDMSQIHMPTIYKEEIVPTIFYELSYTDYPENRDNDEKSEFSFRNIAMPSKKSRKASRKSRKTSRKVSRKSRKASRKSRKTSRKVSRKSRKASRKSRKSRKVSRKSRKSRKTSRKVSRKSRKTTRKSRKVAKKVSRK
jgi:hypothetical protein